MPTSRAYRFVQVDVFTDRVFGGNPLAVFPEPDGLSDAELQAIAREMNLSETTFIYPPSRPEYAARVRIFTPAREIPFAGHPTIGTAYVLATLGRLPAGATEIELEEGVGPVRVRLEGDPARPDFLWMTHPPARFEPPLGAQQREAVAGALGLNGSDLLGGADGPPVQVGSTGLPFLYVPLRNRVTVDRVALDERALVATLGAGAPTGVFLFAPEPATSDEQARGIAGRAYSRMLAPGAGVSEDPATGSASGPLAAYLIKEGIAPAPENGQAHLLSEQGTAMHRQSFVHLLVDVTGREADRIQVGGGVVPIIAGVLTVRS
jgi:trans-2,3-dihydro-3-hydroxyanthranilate isomerase